MTFGGFEIIVTSQEIIMSPKEQITAKTRAKQQLPRPVSSNLATTTQQQTYPAIAIQRARLAPDSLTPNDACQLQRTIGNQAIVQLLARTKSLPTVQSNSAAVSANKLYEQETDHRKVYKTLSGSVAVAIAPSLIQRFESPEHQDLGDQHLHGLYEYLQTDEGNQWAQEHGLPSTLLTDMQRDPIRVDSNNPLLREGGKIRTRSGVRLSVGDIIALMGDLYPSWQSIMNAPAEELRQLLATMRQERHGALSSDEASARYEEITEGRYLRMAEANDTHFAPLNQSEWLSLHNEAIDKARQAGGDNAAFTEALLIDAAGGHFLTDAFAAGHLFKKREVESAILSYLQSNPIQTEDAELQLYISAALAAGKLDQLVLKNIHDHFNVAGFVIRNGQGMEWRTFGDSALNRASSTDTRHIAALAVFMSRQQIIEARKGGTPNPQAVLDLLPSKASIDEATEQAIRYIPEAAADVPLLIIRNRGMSRTLLGNYLGRWVEAHLATRGIPSVAVQGLPIDQVFSERASRNLLIPNLSSGTGTMRLGPFSLEFENFAPQGSGRSIPSLNLTVPNMNITAPIPGIEGLSGEIDVQGGDLTVGLHLDVGQLLPESWGFGPSLPNRLGDRER